MIKHVNITEKSLEDATELADEMGVPVSQVLDAALEVGLMTMIAIKRLECVEQID